MADKILWKKLTETDFKAMNGKAQQAGSGGGAMHIALGVDKDSTFPIKNFLDSADDQPDVEIRTEALRGHYSASSLKLSGNPERRGGEWRINEQFHNRHPAWSRENGFPDTFSGFDKPIVILVRRNGKYHARLSSETALRKLPDGLAKKIAESPKGIIDYEPTWDGWLNESEGYRLIAEYKNQAENLIESQADQFEADNQEDARKKMIAEVVRRQGQQKFRKELLAAYSGACAVTRCSVENTLQAAHITPYLGPKTNHVSNGILLRADIHTLFDLGYITIDPKTYEVKVASALKGSEYEALAGKAIQLPSASNNKPSEAALTKHNKIFQD